MMKRAVVLVVAATWVSVGAANAGVNCDQIAGKCDVWIPLSTSLTLNCDQVKKYLKTGRTPQDVADTMVIPVDDVKKCQGEAGAAAPAAAGTPGADKAGASAAPEGSKAH